MLCNVKETVKKWVCVRERQKEREFVEWYEHSTVEDSARFAVKIVRNTEKNTKITSTFFSCAKKKKKKVTNLSLKLIKSLNLQRLNTLLNTFWCMKLLMLSIWINSEEDQFKLNDKSDRYKYLSRIAFISSLKKQKNNMKYMHL